MYLRSLCGSFAALLATSTFAATALAQDATPPAAETATSAQDTSDGAVPLPTLDVDATKAKPPKKKSAKKSSSKQPSAAAAASPSPTKPTETLSEAAIKSPPNSFVANVSGAATKTATPILETPQSISVITADQITTRGVKTVIEALQYTPGVYTDLSGNDPRFEQIKIRGFNAQGLGAYRDGLKQLGDPNTFAHFRTETYGLERIDVFRGPTSVLYGQNAPGGIYDMISKRPTEETLREFVGTIGSDERFQGAFDLSGAVDKEGKLLFRLTGLARDADAQIAHFSDFVEDDRLFIAPSLTWQPTADTKLTILTDYQHDVTGHAFSVNQKASGSNDVVALPVFAGDPNFHEFDQEQFRLGYLFEHRFNDQLMARQNLRYGEVDLDYSAVVATSTVLPGDSTVGRRANLIYNNSKSFTVDNQLHAKLASGTLRHTIVAGLDYQHLAEDNTTFLGPAPALDLNNPVYGQTIATPTTLSRTGDQEASQLGVYVQDQLKWQNWILTFGGRYDWAETESLTTLYSPALGVIPVPAVTKDEAFTGRAGLTYVFDFGLAPYVSYSEFFLPTLSTNFQILPSFELIEPFEPTTGQQYEVGIKFEPKGTNMRLTLALFDLTQQNVLTSDPDTTHVCASTCQIQTGEIRSRGFEAEVVASLAEGLDVTASYAYEDVEVTKDTRAAVVGKVPTLVPEHMASIFADYTFPSGPLTGFGLGAGVRYIGSTYKDNVNTAENDAYTVFDGALHYTWDDVRVALNVTNLFDHEQGICSTAGCQWISPRIVNAEVRYRW